MNNNKFYDINSEKNIDNDLSAFYDWHYGDMGQHSDSPKESRIQITKQILELTNSMLPEPIKLLNLGSGRFTIEDMILTSASRKKIPDKTLRTNLQNNINRLDITSIERADVTSKIPLNVRRSRQWRMYQEDMRYLSAFNDELFDIIFSNLAIDFIPDREKAFIEALRVAKSGAHIFFNFHHPELVNMLKVEAQNSKISVRESYINYTKFLDGYLFQDEQSIIKYLSELGFSDIKVQLTLDTKSQDKWWNITARK